MASCVVDSDIMEHNAWVIAHTDWEEYEVLAIFTSEQHAQDVLDEVDLTPTGKRRGYWQIDRYPLNPTTFLVAQEESQ